MEPSQLAEFKTLGYTVLRAVHDQDSMAGWRSTQDYLESTALRQHVSAQGGPIVAIKPSPLSPCIFCHTAQMIEACTDSSLSTRCLLNAGCVIAVLRWTDCTAAWFHRRESSFAPTPLRSGLLKAAFTGLTTCSSEHREKTQPASVYICLNRYRVSTVIMHCVLVVLHAAVS